MLSSLFMVTRPINDRAASNPSSPAPQCLLLRTVLPTPAYPQGQRPSGDRALTTAAWSAKYVLSHHAKWTPPLPPQKHSGTPEVFFLNTLRMPTSSPNSRLPPLPRLHSPCLWEICVLSLTSVKQPDTAEIINSPLLIGVG